jgi:uncharacterized Ntn-hydrolase superfamily protein
MAGFSLSAEELERVCHRMRVQSDRVGEQLARLRAGEAAPMDFGGDRHIEIGRCYGEVLAEVVPRVVREFESAAGSITDRLERTLAGYLATDAAAAGRLR